jgi:hypothetical protein
MRKWLSLLLPLAIISLIVYFCVYYNWFDARDGYVKIQIETYMLCISLLLFFSTIRRLWGIVCTVIEAKPMLEGNGQDLPPSEVPRTSKSSENADEITPKPTQTV